METRKCTNVDDWMTVLKSAPYYLSTSTNSDTPEIRWIASLSNGITVYDSRNIDDIATPSAWLRLKKFCADHKVSITQLRLQYHDLMITLAPHAKGYFFARRMMVLANVLNSFEEKAIGIGHLDKNVLKINWFNDGGLIQVESRTIEENNPKHQNLSLIVNE